MKNGGGSIKRSIRTAPKTNSIHGLAYWYRIYVIKRLYGLSDKEFSQRTDLSPSMVTRIINGYITSGRIDDCTVSSNTRKKIESAFSLSGDIWKPCAHGSLHELERTFREWLEAGSRSRADGVPPAPRNFTELRQALSHPDMFVGRDRDERVLKVDRYLRSQKNPVVMIIGPSGSGKTALLWRWWQKYGRSWTQQTEGPLLALRCRRLMTFDAVARELMRRLAPNERDIADSSDRPTPDQIIEALHRFGFGRAIIAFDDLDVLVREDRGQSFRRAGMQELLLRLLEVENLGILATSTQSLEPLLSGYGAYVEHNLSEGLVPDDAVKLLRAFGVLGSDALLLALSQAVRGLPQNLVHVAAALRGRLPEEVPELFSDMRRVGASTTVETAAIEELQRVISPVARNFLRAVAALEQGGHHGALLELDRFEA